MTDQVADNRVGDTTTNHGRRAAVVALAPTTTAAIIAEARAMAPAKAWRTNDEDDDNVAMRQCNDADMTLTPERMMPTRTRTI